MNHSARLACAAVCAVLAMTALLAARAPTPRPPWGSIKGQVVLAGDKLPVNPEVAVRIDRQSCLAKGPIRVNDLVVHPKSRGVRWVLVWLAPLKGFSNPANVPTILPDLAKAPAKAEVKTSCCVFEPRVLAIREGTALVFKNPDSICHAVNLHSLHTNIAVLLKPGKDHTVKDAKAQRFPLVFSCPVHSWMKGYVGVFRHPYFAVTDADGNFEIKAAPLGRWRLILWQEKVGYVIRESR
jgi:hypothetical protein